MGTIICDSACDLSEEHIKEWGVEIIDFPYSIDGVEYMAQPCTTEGFYEFYEKIDKGAVAKTSLINEAALLETFEKYLKQGGDVLFISFSGGLTATYNVMGSIKERLAKKYPKQKLYYFDTLQVTMAAGLFVYRAAELQKAGKNFEEILKDLTALRQHICIYFAVDDLMYLKRGGRVSAATAIMGTALGIKPVLICDECGKLVKVGTVKGRKGVICKLIDYLKTYGENITDLPIVIIYAGATYLEEAESLKREVLDVAGAGAEVWIQPVGTIIGAHCGPRGVALIFKCKHR